jgi:hemolysin III
MKRNRRREELASLITHAAGIGLSGTAALGLVLLAAFRDDAWSIVSASVFGVTLVTLYTASTLYHSARDGKRRARLRLVDHSAIYLLIAGSYTPFLLGPLRGGLGWSLLAVVWSLAVAGVVFKLLFIGRFPRLSTGIYLGMGWLAVVALVPLVRSLSPATLVWLVAGGLAYTIGTPFYHARRLPYGHAVWHLFVLIGSACHVIAVGLQL